MMRSFLQVGQLWHIIAAWHPLWSQSGTFCKIRGTLLAMFRLCIYNAEKIVASPDQWTLCSWVKWQSGIQKKLTHFCAHLHTGSPLWENSFPFLAWLRHRLAGKWYRRFSKNYLMTVEAQPFPTWRAADHICASRFSYSAEFQQSSSKLWLTRFFRTK